MSTTLFHLIEMSRLIWVRTVLISLLAVAAAVLSPLISPLLPPRLAAAIDAEALKGLLGILSTTMLTITTFSLTIVVTAHLSAAGAVTPRVHRLLREDSRTQTVLATFMGAFVYSIVTLVLMNLRVHGTGDFGTVYLFTVGVIGLVIVAMLRWIQHLTTLGALDSTTDRVEALTRIALDHRRAQPHFGGVPVPRDTAIVIPSQILTARDFGYLQDIDIAALARLAAGRPGTCRLRALPGDWLNLGDALAEVTGALIGADRDSLRAAFVQGPTRTYTLDPEYGLIVLSEIASRALSPAVNDPRTAEDVLIRMLRLLYDTGTDPQPAVSHPWLEVPEPDPGRLVRMAVDPVARDGRGLIEVQLRVQKVLAALADSPDPGLAEAARVQSRRALAYAEAGLPLAEDLARVRALAPGTPPYREAPA